MVFVGDGRFASPLAAFVWLDFDLVRVGGRAALSLWLALYCFVTGLILNSLFECI